MNFNIGKLYQIKKYFWYLYPSKEIAAQYTHPAEVERTAPEAAYYSDYWSKELNCNVSYVSPNTVFCSIEQEGKFLKILSTNGEFGWIIYPKNESWINGCIEEVME